MNRNRMFIAIPLTFLIIAVILITSKVSSTGDPVEEARQAITLFKYAQDTKNVDEMIKYSRDIRYRDDRQRHKEYYKLFTQEPASIISVGSAKAVDSNLVMAEITYQEDGKNHELTLPVYKIDGHWKLVIGIPVQHQAN
ncbi:hypothetical protein [Brevibacillus sp. NRS-1366]|uniref:hypothetical protein n=1 Tax=Brevibacillus sp. NRS-1366 TaxID=3233899 RepID=UPI003D1C2435